MDDNEVIKYFRFFCENSEIKIEPGDNDRTFKAKVVQVVTYKIKNMEAKIGYQKNDYDTLQEFCNSIKNCKKQPFDNSLLLMNYIEQPIDIVFNNSSNSINVENSLYRISISGPSSLYILKYAENFLKLFPFLKDNFSFFFDLFSVCKNDFLIGLDSRIQGKCEKEIEEKKIIAEKSNPHEDSDIDNNYLYYISLFKTLKIQIKKPDIHFVDEKNTLLTLFDTINYFLIENQICSFQVSKRLNFPKNNNKKEADQLTISRMWTKLLTKKYDPNLISFYQFAKISESSLSSFLAYFHILEYYFLEVSDEKLYCLLTQVLNDPKFMVEKSYLDKLINHIQEHEKELDQKDKLKFVLNKFLDENELIQFLEEYTKLEENKFILKEYDYFGNKLRIDLKSGQVIPTLSKIITELRNAVIHVKDRYYRDTGIIPFSDSEFIINIYLPIMNFISTRIINSTAKPFKFFEENRS